MIRLTAHIEAFDFVYPLVISRGSMSQLNVLVVTAIDGTFEGRGECVPMGSMVLGSEADDRISAEAMDVVKRLDGKLDSIQARQTLQELLSAGAVRNAIDCALWDLEAKSSGKSVWDLAGIKKPVSLETAYTISLGPIKEMAEVAAANRDKSLLKLKLGGENDLAAVRAVRKSHPGARLIVDANEGWTMDQLSELAPAMADEEVKLIEQPLPKGRDEYLEEFTSPVPLCADESCHTRDDLDVIARRYDVINIKLDKTGGLTEALKLAQEAQNKGLRLMVGCMAGTSLSMAPAMLIGAQADFVDLDGPLLFKSDRPGGIIYDGSTMYVPEPSFWG